MNERIKELAKEAGLPTALDYHQKRLEKFAELIVEECAMLARKMEIHNVPFIGVKILEHFGVE